MTLELWKPVVGYEGLYEVSDKGRVRALFESWNGRYKAGRIIKSIERPDKYISVNLYYPDSGQVGRTRTMHSLVLEAFVGPRPKGQDVRHLDGTKNNNVLLNLKWGTRKENMGDAIVHGTVTSGERAHFSKLTNESVLKIREMFDSGILSNVIAKMFNVSIPTAWRIGKRKIWRHLL